MTEERKKKLLAIYKCVQENAIYIHGENVEILDEILECVEAFGVDCIFDEDVSEKLEGLSIATGLNESVDPITGKEVEDEEDEEEEAGAESAEAGAESAGAESAGAGAESAGAESAGAESAGAESAEAGAESAEAGAEAGAGAMGTGEVLDMTSSEDAEAEAEAERKKEELALSPEDQNKLLSTLEQVNKNIAKMDGLDDKKELRDIYLQEVGKKHLIETRLLDSGYIFSDVDDVIDKLFESKKVDYKNIINISESKARFNKRFGGNDTDEMFVKMLSQKITRSLCESAVTLVAGNDDSGIELSNSEEDGLMEVSYDQDSVSQDMSSTGLEFKESMEKMLGIFGVDQIDTILGTFTIPEMQSYKILNAGDNFYVCEDDTMQYNLTDDKSEAHVFSGYSKNKLDEIISNIFISLGIECVAEDFTENVANVEKYYKLDRDFLFNNELVASVGTPIQFFNGSYTFDNANGDQLRITNNPNFSNLLCEITEPEYQFMLSGSVLDEPATLSDDDRSAIIQDGSGYDNLLAMDNATDEQKDTHSEVILELGTKEDLYESLKVCTDKFKKRIVDKINRM
jgi:hypothetical protein